jgi:hypothetical protein
MAKKVHLIIKLRPGASSSSDAQLEETIKKDAKIPWCNTIEHVSIEDNEESYQKLTKHGVSSSVARNILGLYTQ